MNRAKIFIAAITDEAVLAERIQSLKPDYPNTEVIHKDKLEDLVSELERKTKDSDRIIFLLHTNNTNHSRLLEGEFQKYLEFFQWFNKSTEKLRRKHYIAILDISTGPKNDYVERNHILLEPHRIFLPAMPQLFKLDEQLNSFIKHFNESIERAVRQFITPEETFVPASASHVFSHLKFCNEPGETVISETRCS